MILSLAAASRLQACEMENLAMIAGVERQPPLWTRPNQCIHRKAQKDRVLAV